MAPSGTAPQRDTPSEETFRREVEKYASNIQFFEKVAIPLGLIVAVVGSIAAIPFGLGALLTGAGLGAAAAIVARAYTWIGKRALDRQLAELKERDKIKEDKAKELKSELDRVYTEHPESLG